MANRLHFNINWQDISDTGVQGPELVATWASLSISLGDNIISELADRKSDTVKDMITLPLYPLAEWVALNWWFLQYEPFTPKKLNFKDYNSRHNLAFAREGYVLPDLSIKPIGKDLVEIEWKTINFKNPIIQFINSGQEIVPLESLKEDLYNFVSKVIDKLDTAQIKNTLLQEEWDSIQVLDTDEIKFCQIAASASIDPFNITQEQSRNIISTYKSLPTEIVMDFFNSCNPMKMKNDAKLISNAIDKVNTNSSYSNELTSIRQRIQSKAKDHGLPWIEGYEAAMKLRKELKLNGHILKDFNDLNTAFKNIDLNDLISYQNLPNSISVVSGINASESPYFVLGNLSEYPKKAKFAYCRALYNYFFTFDTHMFLITKSHVESQKRNRAFAAEFLVPAEKLRKEVHYEVITDEELDDLADKFFVDPLVIKHQLENHNIAKVESTTSSF